MALAGGRRIGAYEIIGPLGSGGMGEVYRARDTKLGREVALKILPAELADDRDRLVRFEQEARAASSLNHPNIVTIYEIGEDAGTSFIAMELVEGKTLRQHLVPGALAVRKLLEIGAQAADGLSKAHGAGIVHRDLKPENLMVTPEGYVKLLDFGLAKLSARKSGEMGAGTTVLETQPGSVLGTVAYMSPEQASGDAVDFRSDQFALGAILYEMATGKRPFQANTGVQTMAAIIQEEPEPIAQINPKVPVPLRWIIERCLAKERERRYASTTDLARDLATLRDRLSEASTATGIAPPSTARRRIPWTVVFAALVLASGASVWLGSQLGQPSLPTFKQLTFRRGIATNARFSPDEKTIVYSAAWDGDQEEIFTVREESPESRSLGVKDAQLLSVSRTGDALIRSAGTISQVPLGGGTPRPLLTTTSWAEFAADGKEFLVVKGWRSIEFPPGKRIYRNEEGIVAFPRFSPDGKRLAFFETTGFFERGRVVIVDRDGKVVLKTKEWHRTSGLAWSKRGDEVWLTATDGGGGYDLLAVGRSGKVRRVSAIPGRIELKDIARDGRVLLVRTTDNVGFSGRFPGNRTERDLSWLDYSIVRDLSDDGRTVLFDESGESSIAANQIYLRSTDGAPAVRIGNGISATLSPDGEWVATVPSQGQVRLIPTGAGEERSFPIDPLVVAEVPGWHPDGKRIVLSGREEGKPWRCYSLELESGALSPITPEGIAGLFQYAEPRISPDGRRLVARERGVDQPGERGIFELDTGKFVTLPWLSKLDGEVYWTADGLGLLAHRHVEFTTEIVRFDVETGRSEVLHRLTHGDPAGIQAMPEPEGITPDGKWYVYNYQRELSDLFVVSGLE